MLIIPEKLPKDVIKKVLAALLVPEPKGMKLKKMSPEQATKKLLDLIFEVLNKEYGTVKDKD